MVIINYKGSGEKSQQQLFYIIYQGENLMRVSRITILMALILVFTEINCKVVKKDVQLHSLSVQTQTVFLTKFDIGAGAGNFSVQYRKLHNQGKNDFDKVSLSIGLLIDDNYTQFKKKNTCQQKIDLYHKIQKLPFLQSSWGNVLFKVQQQTGQHIWYLYLFDCKSEMDKKQLVGAVSFDITMFNNNSHFGEDENLLFGYIILTITWIVLIIRMLLPIANSFCDKISNWAPILIYCGFISLGLAYFYRLLDLFMVYFDGQQILFFRYLYTVLKYAMEGLMVTVIVSIAWGWSLTHLKHEPYYIIIGTIVTIINLIAIILDISADQIEEAHHHYDGMIGFLILLIRVVIFCLFVVGILRCMAESVGKRRHFIQKFGYQGGVFLIAWPLTVIFVQIFLPNYMHNQVVTIVEQGAYIIANAYMCRLFAFPDTDFKKVSLKDDDEYRLPDYKSSN